MTYQLDVARGRGVVARWCNLAEQRLEYLTGLFETGRWRRYYSELAFLENIQEAKNAVETWRDLSVREASRDNSAVDISWLSRNIVMPSRGDRLRDQAHQRSSQIASEPVGSDVSITAASVRIDSDDAPSAPAPEPAALEMPLEMPSEMPLDTVSELTLDLVAMIAERYPQLRNTL